MLNYCWFDFRNIFQWDLFKIQRLWFKNIHLLFETEWRIYVSVNFVIIGSDNGLLLDRHQVIIQTIAGILLIGPLVTNHDEIIIKIQQMFFKKMHLKISSAKFRHFFSRLQCVKNAMFQMISILPHLRYITSADSLLTYAVYLHFTYH